MLSFMFTSLHQASAGRVAIAAVLHGSLRPKPGPHEAAVGAIVGNVA